MFVADSTDDLPTIFLKNNFDTVIHLATAYIKTEQVWKDILAMNYVNISFPSVLLELASLHHVKAFINTGSCAEYKAIKRKINESDALEPNNYYAATKVAFERVLQYYSSSNKLRAITLKLFYPYGEEDNKKIIPLLIQSAINNKILYTTAGEQQLSFTYVEDIIDAYAGAIDFVRRKKDNHYQCFNIGTDKTYSINEIRQIIEKVSGKKTQVSQSLPYPPNEIMYMACDYRKAKELFSWKPKTDIREGLRKTYLYYLKHG